jgi:hypothetical protein
MSNCGCKTKAVKTPWEREVPGFTEDDEGNVHHFTRKEHGFALSVVIDDSECRFNRLRKACSIQEDEICQAAGKVLGYPWFKDDQKNFPGATEANGVSVGEHVAASIVEELVQRYKELEARIRELEAVNS